MDEEENRMDEERNIAADIITNLAILKCVWSVASIACTRKCTWPVVWLLFVEVLQCCAFALKMISWPPVVRHVDPSQEESMSGIECLATCIETALISVVALIQCIDEVLMLRRERSKWIAVRALVQIMPMVMILTCWCVWISLAHQESHWAGTRRKTLPRNG